MVLIIFLRLVVFVFRHRTKIAEMFPRIRPKLLHDIEIRLSDFQEVAARAADEVADRQIARSLIGVS